MPGGDESVAEVVEKIRDRGPALGLMLYGPGLAKAWYQEKVKRHDFDPREEAEEIVLGPLRKIVPDEAKSTWKEALAGFLEGLKSGRLPLSTAPAAPPAVGADPIEYFRGEFIHEATDLVVQGAGIDFAFHRTYRHQTTSIGPLGQRWDHGYNLFLLVGTELATLSMGGGRIESYRRHARWDDDRFCYYVPPDGVHATLEPIGVPAAPAGWVRREPDGMRHVFEPEPGWSGAYRLARIEDRWGKHLRFTYVTRPSGTARIDRCYVNDEGRGARWVQFAYDEEDRIVRLADHTGRVWRYRLLGSAPACGNSARIGPAG